MQGLGDTSPQEHLLGILDPRQRHCCWGQRNPFSAVTAICPPELWLSDYAEAETITCSRGTACPPSSPGARSAWQRTMHTVGIG